MAKMFPEFKAVSFQVPIIQPENKYNPKSTKTSNFSDYLIVYFNFTYYLFYSPFKIIQQKSGFYIPASNKFHTLIVLILHSLGYILRIADFRILVFELFRDELLQNPEIYFRVLSHLVSVSFQAAGLYRIWFHSQDFVDIIHFSHLKLNQLSLLQPKSKVKCIFYHFLFTSFQYKTLTLNLFIGGFQISSKHSAWILCVLYTVLALHQSFQMYIVAPAKTWSETFWNRNLTSFGRYAIFLSNATQAVETVSAEELKWFDHILAVFVAVGRINR